MNEISDIDFFANLDNDKSGPSIDEKLAKLRDMRLEFSAIEAEMKRLEKEVKAEILETGAYPSVEGVKVQFRKGGESVRWDSKALQAYAVANPDIWGFAKITERKPTIALSFG